MEIHFGNRVENWRGRGRPPREPSQRVLELLRHTAATGTVAIVELTGADAEDLGEVKADLRAAQRLLGGQVHYQVSKGNLQFFWEPVRRVNGNGR
jgi:hypothetical protein